MNPERIPAAFEKVGKRELNVVPYSTKKHVRISAEKLCKDYGIPVFYAYHMALVDIFYRDVLGVPEDKIRFLEKGGDEKAFYNKIHMDIEVDIESWNGFKEVGGLHYRGDYDLTSHTKGSNQELSVSIDGKKVMPNVLELSFGVDRNLWMLIDLFYAIDGERKLLKLKPYLAPFIAAIFPLQKDEKINDAVKSLHESLKTKFRVFIDEGGIDRKRDMRGWMR